MPGCWYSHGALHLCDYISVVILANCIAHLALGIDLQYRAWGRREVRLKGDVSLQIFKT